MEAIHTTALTKRYSDTLAVDRLDLSIHRGELFSLLGVNGAGKSTAIKMLSCLTAPTAGEAYIEGYSVTEYPLQVKSRIGVSPQETAVAPLLTVRENLELIGRLHGFSKEKSRQHTQELAERLGLQKVLSQKAGTLSGGYGRRLSIAMALIGQPSVLFLDEPTLGLDVLARQELWDIIRGLKGSVTVLLTTHYMEEAATLSDRIGIMKEGRMLVTGTVQELMEQTGADTFEKAFVATVKEGAV